MIPRRSFCLALVPACANALLAQQGHPVPATPCSPEALTKSIESVIDAVDAIKPGMTRGDLLTIFTDEGGIFTRAHRTYVYRPCVYIKVDVDFAPVTNPDAWLTEMSGDKILKISKPYLQYRIMD